MSSTIAEAPWKRFIGAKRLGAELKALQRSPLASGEKPQISHITPVADDLFKWRFRVKNFDEDVAPGKTLNQDLQEMGHKYGQDYLVMEVQFPPDYPTNPFFLRLVSPRCVMYTGHVTAGGSICIEALVPTGGPGGWRPDYSVEGILVLVLANMLHAEWKRRSAVVARRQRCAACCVLASCVFGLYTVATVRTATGPGGVSGPLRVDLSRGRHCVSEYSMMEAKAAYDRTVANHGWSGRGGAGAKAAAKLVSGPAAGLTGALPLPVGSQAAAAWAMCGAAAGSSGTLGVQPMVPPLGAGSGGGASGVVAAAVAAGAAAPPGAALPGAPSSGRTRSRRTVSCAQQGQQAAANGSSGGAAGAAAGAALASAYAQPAPAAAGAIPAVKRDTVDMLDDDDDNLDELGMGGSGRRKTSNRGARGLGAAAAAVQAAAGPSRWAAVNAAAAGRPPLPLPQRKRPAQAIDDDDDVICLSDSDDGSGQAAPPVKRDGGAGAGAAAGPSAPRRRGIAQVLESSDGSEDDLEVVDLARSASARGCGGGAGTRQRAGKRAGASGLARTDSTAAQMGRSRGTGGAAASGSNATEATSPGPGEGLARRVRRRIDANGAAAGAATVLTAAAGVVDLTAATTPSPLGLGGAKAAAAASGVVIIDSGGGAGPSRRPAVQAGAAAVAAVGAGGGAAGGAAVAADAALAAVMAQLEAAQAKLEEERRDKERLKAKMQQLAVQALLAKNSEQDDSGAGANYGGPDVLLSAPPPPHWEPMRDDEGFGVKLVVLPLPGDQAAGTSVVAAPGSASAFAPPPLSRGALAELEANGLSPSDAADLLRHCNGDLDEALALAMEAAECGGIMALLKRQRRAAADAAEGGGAGPSGPAADAAAAEAANRAARQQAVRGELEHVLARWEKASGLPRSRIVRVERVQNWRLWTKYCIRRREVEALLRQQPGSQLNEFFMWHGTSTKVVQAVVTDGFDMRESHRGGSLGEGTYFAANASYSVFYSTKHLGMNALATAVGMPGAFGLPGLPGMPPFGWPLAFGAVPGPVAAAPAQPPSKKAGAAAAKAVAAAAASFPGKAGAMMLCRVVIGRLAQGGPGIRKPPAGADSVYSAGTLLQGQQQVRQTTRPKRGKKYPPSVGGAAAGGGDEKEDDEAIWHVGSALGDNLIVSVFDNAQAYPEYIVHFD